MRLRLVRFTDLGGLAGASGIEIAQCDGSQPIRCGGVGEHALHHELAHAIGIDGGLCVVFINQRCSGISVDGCRGRKHQSPNAMPLHGLQ
ncbi:hypothetical protein CH75_23390 [Dyella jiangningensis]|nr:hypothetical protein CH75_00305 [Dyella jiangningensis]AHX16482.1 hypothetical protein CH75_23390 [Dyella jiangningensis]